MRVLRELGLEPVIREVVARGTPFLGICLGMQILFDHSEEDGGTDGLGLVGGSVKRFPRGVAPVADGPRDKVPHMGWNGVALRCAHPVFEGIESGSEFYFVHSYYAAPADPARTLGETRHCGVSFTSVVAAGNLVATQFHPEKSGRPGLNVLANFSRWDGAVPGPGTA
jgi:glutamine amidotransferase